MVNTLHGYRDSTVISRLGQSGVSIDKRPDKNHIVKNFTKDLYQLRDKDKKVTPKVITHLKMCFSYALSQNQGNPEDLKKHMDALVPHNFGDHKNCKDLEWCKSESVNYCHNGLPHKKPLEGKALRDELQQIVSKHTRNLMQIPNLGSSQANENFNFMVSRKAPKAMFFASSTSLDNRVAAAVAQKMKVIPMLQRYNYHNNSVGVFLATLCKAQFGYCYKSVSVSYLFV